MPKKEYKKYSKEFSNRSAKIPWKYYRKIIEDEYGAEEQKRSHSGGSKRSYMIGDFVFVVHEPHKKDEPVGKWDHHNILDLFKRKGLIKNEDERSERKE